MEHPNARLIRHGYEAFARGDLDALRELIADYAVWHEPGRSVLAGDHKGPDGILALFRQLQELSGGTFRAEPVEVLVDNERAVVIQRCTAEREGRHLDVLDAVDYEIHAGRVTEVSVFQSDTYAWDEFWS